MAANIELALKVIEAVEKLTGEKLPREIAYAHLISKGEIFIRFRRPKHFDSGEIIYYYGTILFRDDGEDTITALHVLDYEKVLEEAQKPNPKPFTGLIKIWPPEE